MKRFLRENWLVVVAITVVAGGFLFLRTPGEKLASTAAFDTQVTSGTPTLVEFYANT